jgi:hypothetical protein
MHMIKCRRVQVHTLATDISDETIRNFELLIVTQRAGSIRDT